MKYSKSFVAFLSFFYNYSAFFITLLITYKLLNILSLSIYVLYFLLPFLIIFYVYNYFYTICLFRRINNITDCCNIRNCSKYCFCPYNSNK